MKIIRRIALAKPYEYFEVQYDDLNEFELHHREVMKMIATQGMTPEDRFNKELDENPPKQNNEEPKFFNRKDK